MGMIEEYTTYLLDHVPTNKHWATLIATTLVSSILTRKTYVITKIGPLRLNLFTLMIGPSGMSNKTAPLLYHMLPLIQRFNDLASRDILLPTRYSVEGMIEYLTDQNLNSGVMIRDEFTSLFKDINNKKYMADGLEFLSEMYDGYIHKRYTRSTKAQNPNNVYVNFISATTPYLFQVMQKGFFMQGTGNRKLYIYDTPDNTDEFESEDFLIRPQREYIFDDEIEHWAQRLFQFSQVPIGRIGFEMGAAADKVTHYRNDNIRKAKEMYDSDYLNQDYSYVVRMHEKAIKLAALHCVSTNLDNVIADPDVAQMLLIREEDVDWAIDLCNECLGYYYKMMNVWASTAEVKSVRTERSEIDYVLYTIRNAGENINHTSLRKKLGWTNNQKFVDVMNLLIDSGDIIQVDGNSSNTGGRKGKLYSIAENINY